MKTLIKLFAIALVAGSAYAAEEPAAAGDKKPTAQQSKMKTCNAEAGEKTLKGDERKAFMKECLSAKPAAAKSTQQDKMKSCNQQAGEKALKGAERKSFMSECLKG